MPTYDDDILVPEDYDIGQTMTAQRAAQMAASAGVQAPSMQYTAQLTPTGAQAGPRGRAPGFLYDGEEIAAAGGVTNVELFRNIANKSDRRTNMTTNSQLTAPNSFVVAAVGFDLWAESGNQLPMTDMHAILKLGRVEFHIGNRKVWECGDLTKFPAGGGIIGRYAPGNLALTSYGQNGAESPSNLLKYGNKVRIRPQTDFVMRVYWDDTVGGTAEITEKAILQCHLYGWYEQWKQ